MDPLLAARRSCPLCSLPPGRPTTPPPATHFPPPSWLRNPCCASTAPRRRPALTYSITNDAAAKAGKLTFRGSAVSHATGPEAHSYQLDLELCGEIDESDIKQVGCTL